ncbi:MAG: hypothetical protein U9N51_00440 [Bacteroidota bacterium]|nr:hypothetical protein [Bacteroidota bacterium]
MQKLALYFIVFIGLICSNAANAQRIEKIIIHGNEQTKAQVIYNELGISEGDDLPAGGFIPWAKAAKQRLENTSLFVAVNIGYETTGGQIVILVDVQERWYYWAYPILEHADRNFASFLNARDWKRVNYGLSFEKHNFRGRNEFLKFKMRFGYRSQFGFMYDNLGIDKDRSHGIQISADRFKQSKILYALEANYPEYAFAENESLLTENRFRLLYSYRPELYQRIKFMAEYRNYQFGEVLDSIASDYLFQQENQSKFLSFYLKYEVDRRNVKYYPTDGYLFSANVEKHGLGVMRSEVNLFMVKVNFHYFQPLNFRLSFASKAYFTAHLMNKASIPFLFSNMLGNEFYPRGYEYRMVAGNAVYGLNETLRMKIYQAKPMFDNLIPFEQFKPFTFTMYAYGFFDFAYVDNSSTSFESQCLENQVIYSGGIGADFVTYYDRSIGLHFAMTNQKDFGIFATLRSPIYKTF